MGRTCLDLCNDILREMYYETNYTSLSDLLDTTEGAKAFYKLNQINTEVCVQEKDIWQFRQRTKALYLIGEQNKYPMVNGYIEYIVPIAYPAPLIYNTNWKYLPRNSQGRPIMYRIYNDMIEMFPIPNNENDGLEFEVKYLTYDCAKDSDGNDKETMTLADDETIIPNRYRDLLVYGVCKDLRANINDSKSQFFEKRYKEIYREMLSTMVYTADYPSGLDIMGHTPSVQESSMSVFYNPRAGNN